MYNSNIFKEKRFKEEHDFFLSYLNDKIHEIDGELSHISLLEQREKLDCEEKLFLLNERISMIESQNNYEKMKEHYYNALNHRRNHQEKSKKKNNIEEEKRESEILFKKTNNRSILNSLVNLILISKFLKKSKFNDDILNGLGNYGITLENIEEMTTFYKSIFSINSKKNFSNHEEKILFANNMLEVYCNETHPLHNHFSNIRQKIEILAKNPIFLQKNSHNEFLQNNNLMLNSNKNLLENSHLSGSQSDDAKRVIKKNFARSKNNIENYDGDSEKSMHKSEREEVKEENEEECLEDKAKSDGEKEKEVILNEKPKNKNSYLYNKINKGKKKSKKLKKIFDDSGDHATGSASDQQKREENKKIFTWGLRGIQKMSRPQGFDTDKDMKL